MPLELKIWKLGKELEEISTKKLDSENIIHDLLYKYPELLNLDLLPIGKKVKTGFNKEIDILGLDGYGNLVVVELKKHRTARDIVAQCLDYGSWVKDLDNNKIREIFKEKNPGKELEQEFSNIFEESLPEILNETHLLLIIAAELDSSTERIVKHLSEDYKVPINVIFFRYYKIKNDEFLARAWLIDPHEVEANLIKSSKTKSKQEIWNENDFYVSLGEGEWRTWEDCVKYGYISGGGKPWYSQTLKSLKIGNRVFVNIPQTGFVGVGKVSQTALPMRDAKVLVKGKERFLKDLKLKTNNHTHNINDLKKCEWVVPIDWIATNSKDDAFWEKGLFASQHTACKLRSKFTIDRLVKFFKLKKEDE